MIKLALLLVRVSRDATLVDAYANSANYSGLMVRVGSRGKSNSTRRAIEKLRMLTPKDSSRDDGLVLKTFRCGNGVFQM